MIFSAKIPCYQNPAAETYRCGDIYVCTSELGLERQVLESLSTFSKGKTYYDGKANMQ